MLLLVEAACVGAVFAVVWFICVRIGNYGFLDVTWTLSIGVLALIDGWLGSGTPVQRVLVCAPGVLWSARLGVFVLLRVLRHHPAEDERYRSLRERWRSPLAFLAFFELQALIALVFSAPFLSASMAGDARVGWLEAFGLMLTAIGIVGEAVADRQSASFKKRAHPGKRVLDVGLWRYSRHPNYFCESLVWIGLALAALPLPYGWIALVCPALILYFLLRVTGIPLTERHSLVTHGEAYRDYQRRTSAFVPWVPKVKRASSK